MKKKLLSLIILLAIGSLILIGGYFWILKTISKQVKEANAVAVSLSSDRSKFDELEGLKRDMQKTLVQKDKLVSFFLLNDSAAEFIQSIETLAKSVGVSQKTISVSSNDVSELSTIGKEEMNITLEVLGSYSKIMNYVSLLELLPYKSYISELKLSSQVSKSLPKESTISKNGSSDKWGATVTLKVVKTKSQ